MVSVSNHNNLKLKRVNKIVNKEEISYENEVRENITIPEMIQLYQGAILIFVNGSYDNIAEEGKYRYILQYNNHLKYEEKSIHNASVNRAMLIGILDAITRIKGKYRVVIITGTTLGFQKAFKEKGVNADIIQNIFLEIIKRECKLTEVNYLNGAGDLGKYILSANPNKEAVKKYYNEKEKQKAEVQKFYRQKIYKECLMKVNKLLQEQDVNKDIIEKVMKIEPND